MGFKNESYATVWVTDKEKQSVPVMHDKFAEIFITISQKNKTKNEYETTFSERVRFVGKAFEHLKSVELHDKDRIKLLAVEVNQNKVADKKYTNYICWDFEKADNAKPVKETPKIAEVVKIVPVDDDNLPF